MREKVFKSQIGWHLTVASDEIEATHPRCQVDTLTTFWWRKLIEENTILVLYLSTRVLHTQNTMSPFLCLTKIFHKRRKFFNRMKTLHIVYLKRSGQSGFHQNCFAQAAGCLFWWAPSPLWGVKAFAQRGARGSWRVIEPFNPQAPRTCG